MHFSEKDGTRCQAMSMHNEYMCYAHRTDEVLTVVQNDMFLIENVDTHAAIQKAFGDVAARLACNHIDLKRAELLITLLRAAARNLRAAAAARREAARTATAEAALEPVIPADAAPTAASTHPEDAPTDHSPTAEQEAAPEPVAAPPFDFAMAVSQIPGSLHFGVPRPPGGWDDVPPSPPRAPAPPEPPAAPHPGVPGQLAGGGEHPASELWDPPMPNPPLAHS
jgi:hypothetical protein